MLQNAGEYLAIYRFQQVIDTHFPDADPSVAVRHREAYETYRDSSQIQEATMAATVYAQNIESAVDEFAALVVDAEPEATSAVLVSNMKQGRAAREKADFIIRYTYDDERDDKDVPVSLKNYAGSINRPQVASGTYMSFVLNFLYESPTIGFWKDPSTGQNFNSQNAEEVLLRNGHAQYLPVFKAMKKLHREANAMFAQGTQYQTYDEKTDLAWKAACLEVGQAGMTQAIKFLNLLPADQLKQRALKLAGLTGSEEVLFLAPGKMFSSYGNERYAAFLNKVQAATVSTSPANDGEKNRSLRFAFTDPDTAETIISFDVPFTLNANGAWYRPAKKYEGQQAYKAEGLFYWGERRVKKADQLASSTNTYVNFGATGLLESV